MKEATKGDCRCFIYTIFYLPVCLRGVHLSRPHSLPQHTAVALNFLRSAPEIQVVMGEEGEGEEKKIKWHSDLARKK